MAFTSDDFSFALATGARLTVHVVVSSSQLNSAGHFSLTTTLFASDYIVRVLGASSFTVWACNLFLHEDIKFFSKIEIF